MTGAPQGNSFWVTLPGVLTGVAAVLTALVGVLALFMGGGGQPVPDPPLPSVDSTPGGSEGSQPASPPKANTDDSAGPEPPPGSPAAGGAADQYLLFRGDGIDVDSGQSGSGVTEEELQRRVQAGGHLTGGREAVRAPSRGTLFVVRVPDPEQRPAGRDGSRQPGQKRFPLRRRRVQEVCGNQVVGA